MKTPTSPVASRSTRSRIICSSASTSTSKAKPVGAIDEFETEAGPEAGKFVGQITDKSGGEGLGGIKALSVDSKGDVYAVEEHAIGRATNGGVITQSDVVVYGPDVFPPVLTLAAATHRTPTGAQLSGTV